MTDPFSFIGACAAIVQLTSSGSRAAIVLSEICRNSQSTADTIDSYLTELDCFIDVAEKIRSERRSTTLDIRMEKLMKDYVSQTTSLQNLLRPLVMAQGSSRSAKILKSVKYQHKSKKIEHLIHAIERKIALLMYYHGPLEGIARHTLSSAMPVFPGFWMVDLSLNQHFINRGSIVESIEEKLKSSSIREDQNEAHLTLPNFPHMVAIYGVHGSGSGSPKHVYGSKLPKAQVALAFARRFKLSSQNRSVFWTHARNQIVFEHDFLRIGRCAQETGANKSRALQMCDITSYLDSDASGEWLLIVDSIDLRAFSNPHILSEVIPKTGRGTVILTSHRKLNTLKFGSLLETITLGAWEKTDAKRLLEIHTERPIPEGAVTAELLSELELLPLAIVQAASYMKRTSISISQYVRLLRRYRQRQVELLPELSAKNPRDVDTAHPKILLLQAILSVEAVSSQNAIAEELLFFIACVEPSRIPIELLRSSYHESRLNAAIELLKDYSLVTLGSSGDVLHMHSLTHLAIGAHLRKQNTFTTYARRAFMLVFEQFVTAPRLGSIFHDSHQWLLHALSAWQAYMMEPNERSSCRIEEEVVVRLVSDIAWHLRSSGSYTAARGFLEKAVQQSCAMYGFGSSCFLACWRNFAMTERELGNFERVAEILSTSIEAEDSFFLNDHPDIIGLQGEIGLWLQSRGLYHVAEEWHWKAIELSDRHFGHEHAVTLKEGQNHALSLYRQGKLEIARDCFESILKLRKEQFGLYDIDTLETIDSLALVLQAQGQHELAKQYLQQALEGREAILGPSHPNTFYSRADLAESHRQCGELFQAERLTKEALEFFRMGLGETHPTTLILLGNLGILHQCRGSYCEAERITKEVVYRRGWKLGPTHPDTLLSMFDLSVLFQCQEKHKDALNLGQQVLAARRRIMPNDDPGLRASEIHVPQLQENLDSLRR